MSDWFPCNLNGISIHQTVRGHYECNWQVIDFKIYTASHLRNLEGSFSVNLLIFVGEDFANRGGKTVEILPYDFLTLVFSVFICKPIISAAVAAALERRLTGAPGIWPVLSISIQYIS